MWHGSGVDVDAFSALRESRWRRLDELAKSRRRTGADADEMTRLYRSTAADLSAIRSAAPEPGLITRLSILLAKSRVWLTGSHTVRTADVRTYFATSLPAAMYRVRWWGAGVGIAVVAMSILLAVYTSEHPAALDLIGTSEERQAIASEEFASYYTEYDNTSFGAMVWTNNAWLAVECIAFGFTGVFPLYLLYGTVFQLGVAAAVMQEAGMLDVFFKLILPHGLLELSAVFVAAGAGLKVFWTIWVPGDKPRGTALSEVFRTLLSVALGLTIALLVSGLIEGYVTPSHMPWQAKIAIGGAAFVVFWMYVFIAGRAAARSGATGDAEAAFAAERAPVAA